MGRHREFVYPNTVKHGFLQTMNSQAVKIAILFFATLCIFVPQISGQKDGDQTSEAVIRVLEREWTVGQSHDDVGVLELIFDNALVYVEYGRLLSKGEYLSRIHRSASTQDQIAMDPITVRIFGNTAIVSGSYSEINIKEAHRKVSRWRFIDTWVYKKNGWVLVAAGAAPISG